MMAEPDVDILVIGGGPGGYTAAIRAAQLGFEVALAEKAELGGVCLNWGCIPTKSLLHAADVLRTIEGAASLGLEVSKPKVRMDKLIQRSRQVASRLSAGVTHLMKKNAIKVIDGQAVFHEKNRVQVGDDIIRADKVVVATGASPRNLPQVRVDGSRIWDARLAMTPPFKPGRLLIIGAGAIGVEFASFYRALGVEVVLVEAQDRILPTEDAEIAGLARRAFSADGIDVRTSISTTEVKVGEKELTVVIDGRAEAFDAAILSVGVTGNIDDLGLERIGIDCEGGFIRVGGDQGTNVPGVHAIGDVTGAPCLAHKASHEGIIAVESIAGMAPPALDRSRIPACTYSHPQIASIGLTEARAREERARIRVGSFPLMANGKAVAINDTDGMVKTVFDASTGELLGAHLLGPGVTEMVQGFAVAMGLETTEAELMQTIFPHPTLSEAMHESVLGAYGRTINL